MFAGRINDTDFKGIQGKLLVVEGEFVHLRLVIGDWRLKQVENHEEGPRWLWA
jgi:hypothetical protein